jgi:hypothetical protein
MGRSDTLNPAAGKNSGTASVEAWFAGGERFGYDPTAAAIVASAPLKVFLRCEGDLADAVSFLPGYPDGSFGWAKVLPYLPNARPRVTSLGMVASLISRSALGRAYTSMI